MASQLIKLYLLYFIPCTQFSTGYYQYNIAKNFKGAEKILEAMGYGFPASGTAKPVQVKMMQLKQPKNLLSQEHKTKLAKTLVDLVLFDFELSTLINCIYECNTNKPGVKCTIMDAWKARKNTRGGYKEAVRYLLNYPTNDKEPANNKYAKNVAGKLVDSGAMASFDRSTLPPPQPDIRESVEFPSVTSHINPSSDFGDDDNELIKDSTQLGYRNPPEAKPQNLQYIADTTGRPPVSADNYKPPDWLPVATSSAPVVEISTASALTGQGQCANSANFGDNFQYTQPPHVVTTAATAFSSNTITSGQLHSFPASATTNAYKVGANTQFGSSAQKYSRQKSFPDNVPLSGDGENATVTALGTTANDNHLTVYDNIAITTPATAPSNDQPTLEASQAPPQADSKYGKTNLNYLKNKLQQQKEITETVVQTSAAPSSNSQSASNYANIEAFSQPSQGVSDSATKPFTGKTDLTSLRSNLEKKKEVREKTMVANNDKKKDYSNMDEISSYVQENPMAIKNLPVKKPVATPRSTTGGEKTYSASSTSSSKRTYQLWQCAHCEKINKVHHVSCENCGLTRGKMAIRSIFCEFCQLMIFMPLSREFKDTCCPRCKQVHESTL